MEHFKRMQLRQKITEISDLCYRDQMQSGKVQIQIIIPDLAELAAELTEAQQKQYLNSALAPLLAAVEGTDSVYLADILYYELMPYLTQDIQEESYDHL